MPTEFHRAFQREMQDGIRELEKQGQRRTLVDVALMLMPVWQSASARQVRSRIFARTIILGCRSLKSYVQRLLRLRERRLGLAARDRGFFRGTRAIGIRSKRNLLSLRGRKLRFISAADTLRTLGC